MTRGKIRQRKRSGDDEDDQLLTTASRATTYQRVRGSNPDCMNGPNEATDHFIYRLIVKFKKTDLRHKILLKLMLNLCFLLSLRSARLVPVKNDVG